MFFVPCLLDVWSEVRNREAAGIRVARKRADKNLVKGCGGLSDLLDEGEGRILRFFWGKNSVTIDVIDATPPFLGIKKKY